jgi:hypothetical protein
MFNSRLSLDGLNASELAVYGVAISGGKALERNVNQNEKWLSLVDDRLLSVSLQTRSNYGAWLGETHEGGLLCLVDYVNGLAFEGLFLELASELGEVSEEAILVIQADAKQVYSARLLYHGPNGLAYWESLKTWKGGE